MLENIIKKVDEKTRAFQEEGQVVEGVVQNELTNLDVLSVYLIYRRHRKNEDLQNVLDNSIGKHVAFETRYIEPQQTFEENYVNLQAINFDIVMEDDEKEN